MKTYKIAVIPGDGVGPEVLKEGMKMLKQAAECSGAFSFEDTWFPWGCGYYLEHGQMMPGMGSGSWRALTPFIWARWAIPGAGPYFPVGSSFEDPEKL